MLRVPQTGYLVRSEILHRCRQGIQLGLLPSVFGGLLNQKYIGDVTIVPPLSFKGYASVISNPTTESLAEFVRVGEKRTWPSIALIRSQCELEIVLDQCVRKLAVEAQHAVTRKSTEHGLHSGIAHGSTLEGGMKETPRRCRHTHLDLNNFFGTSSVLHGAGGRDENQAGYRSTVVASILSQDERLAPRMSLGAENPAEGSAVSEASAVDLRGHTISIPLTLNGSVDLENTDLAALVRACSGFSDDPKVSLIFSRQVPVFLGEHFPFGVCLYSN